MIAQHRYPQTITTLTFMVTSLQMIYHQEFKTQLEALALIMEITPPNKLIQRDSLVSQRAMKTLICLELLLKELLWSNSSNLLLKLDINQPPINSCKT